MSVETNYKGFTKDWKCRGFQFEVGKTHLEKGEIKLCENGFHGSQSPLGAFQSYPPSSSVYAVVEQSGRKDFDGTKTASSKIKIKAELSILDLVKLHVEWVKSKTKNSVATAIGWNSVAAAMEPNSVATAMEWNSIAAAMEPNSVATTMEWSSVAAAMKSSSVAAAMESNSVATAMESNSVATAMKRGSVATVMESNSVATTIGRNSVAAAMKRGSVAAAMEWNSVAITLGRKCKASAARGSWVVIAEKNKHGEILNIKTALAGRDIKPDTFYTVTGGEFLEIEE